MVNVVPFLHCPSRVESPNVVTPPPVVQSSPLHTFLSDVYVLVYVHVYVYAHAFVYVYAYVYAHVYAYVHVHVYAYVIVIPKKKKHLYSRSPRR